MNSAIVIKLCHKLELIYLGIDSPIFTILFSVCLSMKFTFFQRYFFPFVFFHSSVEYLLSRAPKADDTVNNLDRCFKAYQANSNGKHPSRPIRYQTVHGSYTD